MSDNEVRNPENRIREILVEWADAFERFQTAKDDMEDATARLRKPLKRNKESVLKIHAELKSQFPLPKEKESGDGTQSEGRKRGRPAKTTEEAPVTPTATPATQPAAKNNGSKSTQPQK